MGIGALTGLVRPDGHVRTVRSLVVEAFAFGTARPAAAFVGTPALTLFRDHRDGGSAQAFFERTLGTTGQQPDELITDHHQLYVKAVATNCPAVKYMRTGLHRARGETTKPIERSHVPPRDRLRSSRGLKTLTTGQRFFEGFEALQALHRGHVHLRDLVPDCNLADAAPHAHARAVVVAVNDLGARLRRAR